MGAEVVADSGLFAGAPPSAADLGSATWRLSTPSLTDTITWTWKLEVDGVSRSGSLQEAKFFVTVPPPPRGPVARNLNGFLVARQGTKGSKAECGGGGFAGRSEPFVGGTNWTATWGLSAKGSVPGGVPGAYYHVEAEADDPFTLTKDDLSAMQVGSAGLRLYLPVALTRLAHDGQGRAGFSVAYESDAGQLDLLSMTFDANGVVAGGDDPDVLSIFRLRTLFENPFALRERPWSMAELEDLARSLGKGGRLQAPLVLGLLLDGVPTPSTEIGEGGVVARFHVRTTAADSEASEEDPRGPHKQGVRG